MAKKKAALAPKKQSRGNGAAKPRHSQAASEARTHGDKAVAEARPQLISARPLTEAKAFAKKNPKPKKDKNQKVKAPVQQQVPAAASPLARNDTPEPLIQSQRPEPTQEPVRIQQQAPAAAVSTNPMAATVDTASVWRPRRPFRWNRRKLLRYATVLLVIVVIPALGFWIMQQRENAAQTANQRLVAEISKKAILPSDEIPSVSTVTDPSKITQQFLQGVKKGDKVLIYFQAAKAVVYRPATGQIVNMGPLSAPSPRVWLRAGTPKADIPKIGRETNENGDFVVVSNDASVNQNYQHTIVVDLSGNRPDIAKRLALQLHAAVGTLPDDENKPDADLLVIVGADNSRP